MTGAQDDKEQLHSLHLALEAALEQLTQAHLVAAGDLAPGELPSDDVLEIEKISAEVARLRNSVRDRLMRSLSRPTLNIVK
jgi:hypothetical protein